MLEQKRLRQLKVPDVLEKYEHIRLVPSKDGALVLQGTLGFTASANGSMTINDCYDVRISVPDAYPSALPIVHETGGRIPSNFHKLKSVSNRDWN